MGKRQDVVSEMTYFVHRMSDSDKVAFIQFVSKYRSSNSLVSMFKAIDLWDPKTEAKGLIKRIVKDQNGNAYKNFHRFKKKVFER